MRIFLYGEWLHRWLPSDRLGMLRGLMALSGPDVQCGCQISRPSPAAMASAQDSKITSVPSNSTLPAHCSSQSCTSTTEQTVRCTVGNDKAHLRWWTDSANHHEGRVIPRSFCNDEASTNQNKCVTLAHVHFQRSATTPSVAPAKKQTNLYGA